jgi:hypothetical protein
LFGGEARCCYDDKMTERLFSDELNDWLKSKKPKTLAGINEVFGEKSFAIIFFILMLLPALPLPTGGATHIFEIIVMLLALELIIGRRTIWIPQRWQNASIGKSGEQKIMPFIYKRLRWFEKHSKSSRHDLLQNRSILRSCGLMIFIFALTAFIAPPFSGLDTIPSLGVVAIALALILNDIRFFIIGNIAGCLGILVVVGLGKIIVELAQKAF